MGNTTIHLSPREHELAEVIQQLGEQANRKAIIEKARRRFKMSEGHVANLLTKLQQKGIVSHEGEKRNYTYFVDMAAAKPETKTITLSRGKALRPQTTVVKHAATPTASLDYNRVIESMLVRMEELAQENEGLKSQLQTQQKVREDQFKKTVPLNQDLMTRLRNVGVQLPITAA